MNVARYVNVKPTPGIISINQEDSVNKDKNKGSSGIGGLVQTNNVTREYHFHFDGLVDEIHHYRDLTMILVSMQETDTLNLYINSPGGYVDTMFQLVNLITTCRGTVIGHLLGPSASAACSIFLACHGWVVHPYSTLMGHTWRGGFWGKGKMDVMPQMEAFTKTIDAMMMDLYFPFFTEEEIIHMIDNNKDVYLTSDEINKRIDILVKHRQEMAAKEVS